jgi:hypothetical protein
VALRTMQNEPKAASSYLHKALAAASGERRYGKDAVRAAYEKFSGATPAAA